jgi:quercetin 2,3-dioxygenase
LKNACIYMYKPLKTTLMKTTHHPNDSRGQANHGWLQSRHTFSFGQYMRPDRMQFGTLRVLNDDVVAAGMGFGRHGHQNMEIVSIPTFGDLKHEDSMRNSTVIKQGDIQIMSAGTGIQHSEMNANNDREVRFFQIWLLPNRQNVKPRYGQYSIQLANLHNQLCTVLSPDPSATQGVWAHQQAWFSLGHLDAGFETNYTLHQPSNGVYCFVIEGSATINAIGLQRRDGLGIENSPILQIAADADTQLLLMEVPMNN